MALVRKLLERQLSKALPTAEYTGVPTAEEALALLARGERFELLIFDEHLGDGNMLGSEAIRKVRQDARHAGTPVVSCTGDADEGTVQGCGADAIWCKPPPAGEALQQQVALLLDRGPGEARAEAYPVCESGFSPA